MNLLQLQRGHKAYGPKQLFDGATFAINEGEHVGVIGPNGAGKSTLFKILIGQEELDQGEVIRSKRLKIGYLEQEVRWDAETTVEDYLQPCSLPIWELKALGRDLGLDESKFALPISSLSGGYRMRCKLLYLIGSEPNLMMLDEPTNYLDLETLLVLEKFLQNYSGAFLLISHDREFLRRTTDHTLEIEGAEITKFPGNIDDYFEAKSLLREQLQTRALSVAAKRKEILDFAAKFGAKASKAKQAQSRLKQLGRMESIEMKPLPVSARIRIPEPERIGKSAVVASNVQLGYEAKVVLSGVDLRLMRGEKVGIVGFNGAGKSTLLKGFAQELTPLSGTIEYGMNVRFGYYAQHVAEELDDHRSVFDELQFSAHVSVTRQDVLDIAGSLLFSGDDVDKRIRTLSGGEKARVALGKILLKRVPILLLDEVTNHLDFDTVEALTVALRNYTGTVVFVSHDRGFVKRVAKKILEIRNGQVIEYGGTYDEYVWSLQNGSLSNRSADQQPSEVLDQNKVERKSESKGSYEQRKEIARKKRAFEKRSKEIEKEITQSQKRLEELSQILTVPQEDRDDSSIYQEVSQLQHQILQREEEWMKLIEEQSFSDFPDS